MKAVCDTSPLRFLVLIGEIDIVPSQQAILLVQDLPADWLIVDEMAARRVARSLNLRVTGLLGLLSKAAERGLVDLPVAIERLRETHFRVDEMLLKRILSQE